MKSLAKITAGLMGQPMIEILTRVNALEAAGRKVYHFEVGDSDFPAYPHIIEATKAALDEGHTKFVSSQGIIPLRQAIADHTERILGFRPDLTQILPLPANSVIDFVIRCVVDPGDDIVFPNPGFPTYFSVAKYLGVNVVRVPVYEKNGFRLNPDDLEACITARTRLVIINSPQNPTGAVMTRAEMERVAAIAREKDVYLLSDEIYAENIYGSTHHSPAIYDQCRERTIILSGFSKGHSMSGWRLGYAIGPEEVMAKMALLFETVYTCLPPFIQYAGVSALTTDRALVAERNTHYRRLRDLMIGQLNSLPGVSCNVPEGAIYVFPNITGTGMTSRQFADFMLDEAGVAVVPGDFFGPAGEGYVRLCYLRNEQMIEDACAAMRAALAR